MFMIVHQLYIIHQRVSCFCTIFWIYLFIIIQKEALTPLRLGFFDCCLYYINYLRFLKIAPKATPSEVKPVPNSGNVEAASPVFGAVCVVDTVCVCGV